MNSIPPKNILVREVNWLGDIVMSLPALKAVRAAFPNAKLTVLIKRELASFFEGTPWIDDVLPFSIAKGWRGLSDRLKIVRTIREKKFDLSILFPNSFDSALWMAWARIPKRAGFSRDGRSLMLTHKVKPSAEILEVHQVNLYLNMLKETLNIEGDKDDYCPDIHASSQTKMAAWLKGKRKNQNGKLIALSIAAAYGPAKEWPAAKFASLIDLLWDQCQAECVLVGSPNEREKCEQVVSLSQTGAMISAGETNVAEALALLSLCDGFAGNDSGSMHVAGALGKPSVGIYGSTRADRTGPLGSNTKVLYKQIPCSPCLKRTCKYGHYDCLNQITPDEVLDSLRTLSAIG